MKYEKLLTRTVLAHKSNFGKTRSHSQIKYIVIHYTANDGDTDEANLKYFTSPNRKASAHFFVDDDSISCSVPINIVAWHCGGKKYKDTSITGGGTLHNIVTNTNSIGIEMCDTVKDKKYNLSTKTRNNVIKLVKALMEDFNIDIDHVVRHFDVTGKHCPVYFMNNFEWDLFKAEIEKPDVNEIFKDNPDITPPNLTNQDSKTPDSKTPISSPLEKQAGMQYNVPFKVKVKTDLNIRTGPSTNYKKVDTIKDNGVYTIIEVKGHWGRLKSKVGWISILNEYVTRV